MLLYTCNTRLFRVNIIFEFTLKFCNILLKGDIMAERVVDKAIKIIKPVVEELGYTFVDLEYKKDFTGNVVSLFLGTLFVLVDFYSLSMGKFSVENRKKIIFSLFL